MLCTICHRTGHVAASCPQRRGQARDRLALAILIGASFATTAALWQSLNSAASAAALYARL